MEFFPFVGYFSPAGRKITYKEESTIEHESAMTATILDGRALAKTLREELRADVQTFIGDAGVAPALAVVQVAGDSASDRYVRSLQKACDDTGIAFVHRLLP